MTVSPPELSAGLREAVRRASASPRLTPRQREQVARELTDHFRDGLEDGRDPLDLLREFGDPDLAAALIGRFRPRGRMGTGVRWLGWGMRAAAVLLTLLYLGSAVRLRTQSPTLATSAATLRGLAEVADRETAFLRWVEQARREAATGDEAAASAARTQALEVLSDLSARPGTFARLTATALLRELPPGPSMEGFPGAATGVDLAEVKAWLDEFLHRVYATGEDGGQLTAEGLRLTRALKGTLEMPARAALLEPVYFAAPAPLDDVRARARHLLHLAYRVQQSPLDPDPIVALGREIRMLQEGFGPRGARYYPLVLVMERLHRALESERRLVREGRA